MTPAILTKQLITQAIARLDNTWSIPLIHEMSFRDAYREMNDAERLQVTKALALAGLLHPTTTRKRKPMTPFEILQEMHATVTHEHEQWRLFRRHLEHFQQSEWFKKAQAVATI